MTDLLNIIMYCFSGVVIGGCVMIALVGYLRKRNDDDSGVNSIDDGDDFWGFM